MNGYDEIDACICEALGFDGCVDTDDPDGCEAWDDILGPNEE